MDGPSLVPCSYTRNEKPMLKKIITALAIALAVLLITIGWRRWAPTANKR